jgi:hypothetical protein
MTRTGNSPTSAPRCAARIAKCLLLIAGIAQAQDTPVRLSAAISLEKKVVTQHEPVVLDLAINNPSQHGLVVSLGYQDEKLEVKVSDPQGQVVERPRPVRSGWAAADAFDVPRGESAVGSVALSPWFSFDRAGVYRIEVTLSPDSSIREPFSYTVLNNSALLDLTVLPRDEPTLRSACADLVRIIENSRSASATIVAANALSTVDDPVAVPFLAQAMNRKEFAALMIGALCRLKTDEAVSALVLASRSSDRETSTLAHSALVALGKAGGA